MTTKNIKKKSLPGDTYYTPAWAVRQFIDEALPIAWPEWQSVAPGSILEPGAGRGVFVDEFRAKFPDSCIVAVDIDPKPMPWKNATSSYTMDFIRQFDVGETKFDLVIGNPPYTFAMEFVKKSLRVGNNVAFLLRQGFMASAERGAFFRDQQPAYVFLLPNRPSFTDDGQTDSADYCWVVWKRDWAGCDTRLHWLSNVPVDVRKRIAA